MIADPLTGTWARIAVVAVVSFVCGVFTFFAQGFLPDAVSSFANSASGWTFVTALLLRGLDGVQCSRLCWGRAPSSC